MAKTQSKVDTYGQTVYQFALETVADAGNITAFQTSIADTSKRVGMIIHRVEYVLYSLNLALPGNGDHVSFGLALWQVPLDDLVEMQSVGLLDWNDITNHQLLGTNGSGYLINQPLVKDFSTLPGGGKICHPSALYVWVRGIGTGVIQNCHARVWYTIIDVDDKFYAELFQAQVQRVIIGG